jgi:hypothetical protein
MTEPSMTPPTADPAPAAPAKRGRRWGILGTIVGVVVAVAVFMGIRFVLNNLGGTDIDDYQVGACVDELPMSASPERGGVPDVVDCADSSAKGKIVGAFDGKRFSDANSLCPRSAVSAIELEKSGGGSLLICLARQ